MNWKYRYIYWFQNLRAAEAQQLLFAMFIMTKTRLLTVEEFGDAFQPRVLPTRLASQIRLKGQWLKRCGFPAGSLAKVTFVSPGILDIRLITRSETPEQNSARLQIMRR